MTRVFISYRTDDETFAAVHLDQRLASRFGSGNVFRDSRHVPPGVDFESELWRNLAVSSVVVAVIGPRWFTGAGTDDKLARPADFVRRELEFALELKIPVVPVLVGGATMPAAAELPESLRALVNHQGRFLHSRDAEASVQRFVDEIDERYGDQPPIRPGTVAVIRAADGPPPTRLAALVRRSTAGSGLAAALVEEDVTGLQVVEPDAGKAAAMVGDFVRALDDGLRGEPDLGQVRVCLHYGDVAPVPDEALRRARQLVAEPLLDNVLQATSGARIALVVSDECYQAAVRPGHRGVDRSTFARVRVADGDAWVQVPGFPAPRGLPATPAPAVPPAGIVNTVRTAHGDFVAGDKVLGDKVLGDKIVHGGR